MDFERDSSGGRRVAMEVQQYTTSALASLDESAGVLPGTAIENRIDPTLTTYTTLTTSLGCLG